MLCKTFFIISLGVLFFADLETASAGWCAGGDGEPCGVDFPVCREDPPGCEASCGIFDGRLDSTELCDEGALNGALENCCSVVCDFRTDACDFDGGDVCNPATGACVVDNDGDSQFIDVDNCPNTFNPDQEDSDGDGAGDACDPSPNDPDTLGECFEDLAICEDTPCADTDGDGECDFTDQCPDTAIGAAVDTAGCSLAQFCASITPNRWYGVARCRFADWGNDEPLFARDCRVTGGACVPR